MQALGVVGKAEGVGSPEGGRQPALAPEQFQKQAILQLQHLGAETVGLEYYGLSLAENPNSPSCLKNMGLIYEKWGRIAQEAGLHHVYTGNVHDSEGGSTFCPECHAMLIERDEDMYYRPAYFGDGWIGMERHYGFEYSLNGDDRHAGRIVLHGRRLRSLVGPMPPQDALH